MYSQCSPDDIKLVFSTVETSPECEAYLYSLLSPDEKTRAAGFKFLKHRKSFIVTRSLLRVLLGNFIGAKPDGIALRYRVNGKPELRSEPFVHFNVSHSEKMVLYGLRQHFEIGVDIEHIRPFDGMEAIATQFFSPAECRDLLSVSEDNRPKAFFNCWTRKEAFVKFLGSGLSFSLTRFQVTLLPGHPARLVHVDDQLPKSWFLQDIAPSDDYAAAVASEGSECRCHVYHLQNPEDVLQLFK